MDRRSLPGTSAAHLPVAPVAPVAGPTGRSRFDALELMPGDIIHSGTPENLGPVVCGDAIACRINKLPGLSIKIA